MVKFLFALTPGLQGSLNAWKVDVNNVVYTTIGVFAFVGGFLIFLKYSQGDDRAASYLIKLITGLAIMGLASLIPAVFE